MRQNRRANQQDVVCKMAPAGPREAEVLQLLRLVRELGCCLQDCPASVSGGGASVAGGFAQRRQGFSVGIASSSPDCGSAIFADCRDTPGGIRDRSRSFSGDSRCGAFAGTRLRRRRSGGLEPRWLEELFAVKTTPFTHKGVCLTPEDSGYPTAELPVRLSHIPHLHRFNSFSRTLK